MIIIDFLIKNGYSENTEDKSDYRSFEKENVSSIQLNEEEIVFIGENGDWLHIPLNYYALIGALLHYRQIAINYIA